MHAAMATPAEVYKKGFLYKRQRGRRSKDLQKLKFQRRFCQLTTTAFEYYKGRRTTQLRGQFSLGRVRIVEYVLPNQFHQCNYSFQIGDNDELMYLAAKSDEERKDWMQAFRTAAKDKGNNMLSYYHPGIYGSPLKNQWGCCKNSERTCKGCQSIHQSISKTWTFPQLSPRPKARKRPQSVEIYQNHFQEEKVTAMQTTPTAQQPQSVPEVNVLLTPVKDESAGEVTVRPHRSRADSGYSSSRCASKDIDSEDFYLDSEDEVPDDDQSSYANILPSFHSQAVTALASYGSKLLSGSHDKHVLLWDTPSSKVMKEVKVSSPVLALDVWNHYLAIGSTSVQLVDMNSKKLRRIMVIDMDSAEEEEPLENLALNLVAYTGTEGLLATASVTSNMVKLWDPPHADESIIRSPKHRIPLGESGKCSVWSLSASHNPEIPWLAVGICLEKQHKPLEKLVRLIDWEKPQECCYSIQADFEPLHTSFSPNGKHLVIGYSTRVDIHDTMSRDLLYYSTTDTVISSLSCYLHQPGGSPKPHLAVGLITGEVQVFELCTETMSTVYTVPRPESESAATSTVYSGDMEALAIGHQNGKIRLYKKSVADSGLRSELSSRSNSASASVGQIKKRSLKQTWSLGHVLDEDVAELNDLAKKHQSQPSLHITSHKSDPGHKESLLHDQVLSKLTSKGGKLHSVCEEEEQTDPYTMFQCFTSPTQNIVQALEFCGPDKLISASYGDSYVHIWDVSDFKPVQSVKVSSSVLALAVWSHYLAIGSNVAQIVDMSSDELRRILFVEDNEGIPSSSLPSQLVAFVGEEGHLATARANSTVVKFWPPPSLNSKVMTSPEACITLAGQIQGISATHNSKTPLLAVIMEVKEICCKSVCLIDLKKREVYKRLISGSGKLSVGIDVASSPDARYISVGSGQKVDVCEARSGADLFHVNTLKTGSSVCSLVYSNDGGKLAVGVSTGEVEVFDPTSNHNLFTLRDPVTCTEVYQSPATSLAYSGDDRMFAVGYQNGVLKLWKAYTGVNDATSHCLENPLSTVHGMDPELYNDLEPLLVREKTLVPQFSENGTNEYQSIEDDFKLIIPEGAIVGDHKVQVAVMKYGPVGPFEYPDGYKPVSPIVWLCSTQKKFHKYLEIILPHCSDLRNSDDEASQTQLVFLKAGHNEYICNTNGQKVFQFEKVDLQTSFDTNSSYGSLHINHCCFYCVGKYMRKDTDQANFCLIVAKPHTTTKKYTITICLTFDLPTCRKAVREQFEKCDLIEIRQVRFAKDRHNATLEIKLNRQLAADAGWLVTLQSQKIKTEDVSSFWNLPSCKDLVEVCQTKLYPPRFTIEVSAKRATKDTFVEVWFDGAVDEHRTEIQLECPTELAPVYVGPPDLNHTPEVLHSQLNGNNTEFEIAAEGIGSSEQEKSEASGLLLPMIKSFNGFVQEPFKSD